MSSSSCDRLHEFADGELAPDEADAFRDHLAQCERCAGELHDVMQLAALAAIGDSAAGVERGAAVVPLAWYRRPRRIAAMAVPALAAAAALLVLARSRGRDEDGAVKLAHAPTRSIEARVSYAGADLYRPYDVTRGDAPSDQADAPLSALAQLEQRGDLHGVAAGYLLLGDWQRAEHYLGQAHDTAPVHHDRAVVALARGRSDLALSMLDDALAGAPASPQVLWNRGLALRDLGLVLLAAESFDRVAAAGEPGWADEAGERAGALREDLRRRDEASARVWQIGVELATTDIAPPDDFAAHDRGLARLMFYDVLRSAKSAERATALLPLAEQLDRAYGTTLFTGRARRVAGEDFAVRGPLAAQYARLIAGERLDAQAATRYLQALRSAGQEDILLGAMLQTSGGLLDARQLEEYRALARRSGDPWFELLAAEREAHTLARAHDPVGAERVLLDALAACDDEPLEFRCGRLELQLADVYLLTYRLAEAQQRATSAWSRARRENDAFLEQDALHIASPIAHYRDDHTGGGLAITRAYLRETVLRNPGDCALRAFADDTLATALINRLDPDAARAQLDDGLVHAGECEAPPMTTHGAFARAQLLVNGADPAAVAALRAELATLRAAAVSANGSVAVLDHIEGRLILRSDRAEGERLLRRAIEAGRRAPAWDTNARRASPYSYSVLARDAARRGDYAGALALIAEESGAELAPTCALGIALEGEVASIAVSPTGAVIGAVTPLRDPQFDASELVPADQLRALSGCDAVAVYARPPVLGAPGLLPSNLAWSYRIRATPAPTPTPGGRRVVVGDAAPPPGLALPRLAPLPLQIDDEPNTVVLRGAAATPGRLLALMPEATELELHAHGIVDVAVADAAFLALSPDASGRHALTARDVADSRLAPGAVVYLAACRAARTAGFFHESWSLASAFVTAGARAVVASPDAIPDTEASAVFAAIRARVQDGASVAAAVRDVRTSWSAPSGRAWLDRLVVFE